MFYPESVWDFQGKLPKALNKFINQSNKNYFAKTSCKISNNFKLSNFSEEVLTKLLPSLDTSKALGIDQIPVKFLEESVKILALLLRNIINLSIKLWSFSEDCEMLS